MRIEKYEFGLIVINGVEYRHDVIVSPSGVKKWWRVKGHEVCVKDLELVEGEPMDILVIGTGYYGLVKVLDEVYKWAEERGVKLITAPTREACKEYNERLPGNVIAALHLTC